MSVIDALVSTADNGQWLGEDLGTCGDSTTTLGDASGGERLHPEFPGQ